MPRTVTKTLTFPLGGVVRRGGYREQTRPYSAPWAVNVRGIATLEDRERGGSRPGLAEVSDITLASQGTWQWPNGETIEWPNSADMEYDYSRAHLTAGSSVILDPASLISVVADSGDAPTDYTISCIYRDRVILCKDNIAYASRMGDYSDFDYGAEMTDTARAVALTIELAGQSGLGTAITEGLDITAAIPHRDKALILATANSLHILEGDPATGNLRVLDEDIGIIAPYAWAFNGETLAFLSNDGVYLSSVGQKPQRFSEGRLPGELLNVDTTSTITMAYDPGARGFHLFITPAAGTGEHYFLEVENKAIWPVVFGDGGHQPVSAARIKSTNLERVMLKGRDGTWREFLDSATDDDGTDLESHVLIGPVRISVDDVRDAVLAELHGIMADNAGTVTWRVVAGDSAETVVDNAKADLDLVLADSSPVNVAASGTWSGGRNFVVRPRARGAWVIVWISATGKWAYEAAPIVARQLGRIR